MAQAEMLKFIEGAGLSYAAQFVPQSQSRNAKPIKRSGDLSLNWKVSLSKNGRVFVTDYMQGIGHVPNANARVTMGYMLDGLKDAAERGRATLDRRGERNMYVSKPLPIPSLSDVLYSLAMDVSVLDCACFEDWARDYGMDTDSREAERTYQACLKIALELRAMLGESMLAQLREAAQDY